MIELAPILKATFGFDGFRPHQQELVEAILSGRDAFGVMPTGGGKSLCYQLPAIARDGCCVVVSPLIALMKDQVDAACANGVRAGFLNSTSSPDERRRIGGAYRSGELDLLYVAPERLSVGGMLDTLRDCPSGGPAFFAIDEAHCISEWGHDFRPDYLFLGQLRDAFPGTPIGAYTATATHQVAVDIEQRLRLREPLRVRASFDRANLFYDVRAKKDWETQLVEFVKLRKGQSGIVYRTTRKSTESTAALLRNNGIDARAYHAGMDAGDRAAVQEAFIRDNTSVIVATVAFGMGIDKSDVRFVIHGDLPKNIESYYQETGRAGRDGEASHCLLLYSPADAVKIRRLVEDTPDPKERERTLALLREMERFAATPTCRRTALLAYFGENRTEGNCGACDFCTGEYESIDATRDAQIVLSAIARSGERFGAVHVCDIVVGANTQKIRQFGHEKLKTYGVGSDRPKGHWRAVFDALLAGGALRPEGDYSIPKFTPIGKEILFGKRAFHRQQDTRVEPEKQRARSAGVDADVPFNGGLFEHLRAVRKAVADGANVPPYVVFADRTLRAMAAHMPTDREALGGLHGIGAHKLDTYGDTFLSALREYLDAHPGIENERVAQVAPVAVNSGVKRTRGETYEATLELLRSGLSLEEIGVKRGFTTGTIEGHIATLIEGGEKIDWRKFVPPEVEKLALELFSQHGDEALGPVIAAADGKLSYGQARMVRAANAGSAHL